MAATEFDPWKYFEYQEMNDLRIDFGRIIAILKIFFWIFLGGMFGAFLGFIVGRIF